MIFTHGFLFYGNLDECLSSINDSWHIHLFYLMFSYLSCFQRRHSKLHINFCLSYGNGYFYKIGYTIATKRLGSTRSLKMLLFLSIIFDKMTKNVTVIFISGIIWFSCSSLKSCHMDNVWIWIQECISFRGRQILAAIVRRYENHTFRKAFGRRVNIQSNIRPVVSIK